MSVAPASPFALRLLAGLAARGMSDVVIAPGARSQALALAALELEQRGLITVHVRIDERVAAFVALGIGLETRRAAAVITTSGSAVANLHPAVLEAHHAGVPLILLTADRPDELHGIGSNQTTAQAGLFGSALRLAIDESAPTNETPDARADELATQAWAAAVGGALGIGAGPAQLNLAFRDPLSSVLDSSAVDAIVTMASDVVGSPVPTPASAPEAETLALTRGPRTLVIAGDGAGPRAEELAHRGGWPLIAEISSGSRFGRNLVPSYREVLRTAEFVTEVERIVVFGHPTLSREVPALIAGADVGVEVVVVRSAAGEAFNPGHRATVFATDVSVKSGETDMEWLGAWMRAGRDAHNAWLERYEAANPAAQAPNVELARSSDVNDMRAFASGELAAAKSPVTRELLVDALWRVTWPHDRLVFGASRLIRVADRTLGGKKVTAFSNRGLAGIDGTISTGIGVALASGSLTRVLLGDLATLHDAGGMLIGTLESKPRIQVVVGNDGGGSLFDSLEVANEADARLLDRAFFTPHGVEFSALAEAYGWEYAQVRTASELERALTAAPDGPQLVEVVLHR